MDDCSCGGKGPGHMERETCAGKHNVAADCCCGRHQKMHGFMEACLLVLLADQACHGYSLAEQLGQFGFEDVNVSTLYRVMRKMENVGWVRSNWEQGGKGPQRRVYAITDVGMEVMAQWIDMFMQRSASISRLISVYNKKAGK